MFSDIEGLFCFVYFFYYYYLKFFLYFNIGLFSIWFSYITHNAIQLPADSDTNRI